MERPEVVVVDLWGSQAPALWIWNGGGGQRGRDRETKLLGDEEKGIFAPMLALGTLFGYAFGVTVKGIYPELDIDPGMFAIAGMGALFAATVRAPITGILLVIEMTNNYYLILPLIATSLGAVVVAHMFGGQPIYSQLLHRTLKNEKLRQRDLPKDAHS